MTERDFCYWLQGFFEISADLPNSQVVSLSERQVEMIRNHLNLVFVHSIDTPDPTGKLQAAHDGKPFPIPGFDTPGGHLVAQTCSVCKTNWWECTHGKNKPRPRC